MRYFMLVAGFIISSAICGTVGAKDTQKITDTLFDMPYAISKGSGKPVLQLLRQDFENLEINKSVVKTPLIIGSKKFTRGLGTHSVSRIRVYSPKPISNFRAFIGANNTTPGTNGSVDFAISSDGIELYKSRVMKTGEEPEEIDVDTNDANMLDLLVGNGGDGPGWDHADWADARIVLQGGETVYLDEIEQGIIQLEMSSYPFSFNYGGKSSEEVLSLWKHDVKKSATNDNSEKITHTWTDSESGLTLTWEAVKHADYPAAEWVIYLENTGKANTPVISDLQALNISLNAPINPRTPYIFHHTNGAPSDPTDYEVDIRPITYEKAEMLGGGGGRSSNKDFPFYKIDTGNGSVIVAVGWSGQWASRIETADNSCLKITAGLEKTNFTLYPGEKIRTPRMLVFHWQGDSLECNAQFRQLIYNKYTVKLNGKPQLPTPFCNTCFTRGGGWLNECNAENQISLIKAYAKLGLEALMTDAGWFTGGWPEGAGNWDARKDAYPNGMGPVAQAAKDNGMIYGLWFEPERVMAGTAAHREHPDWLLSSQDGPNSTYLLNFGLKEVQDYFFNIVKGYMELPGFKVYRQDFNMDPLQWWRYNDAPDRQGITEMKYIEGMYAYWDRIRNTWPDAFMEECASGGRRIDLETLMRMNAHQDSDYWFQYDVDQAQNWGVSQYLPNNLIVQHLHVLDDYAFHSTLASSLCLGWIADAPDFDSDRGRKLLQRYREIRHLLVGAWYPLLPYSRNASVWMASQYHRADLDEGMLIVQRRAECPYSVVQVSLHGLEPESTYELRSDTTGRKIIRSGASLMKNFDIKLAEKRSSDLIVYRKVK